MNDVLNLDTNNYQVVCDKQELILKVNKKDLFYSIHESCHCFLKIEYTQCKLQLLNGSLSNAWLQARSIQNAYQT